MRLFSATGWLSFLFQRTEVNDKKVEKMLCQKMFNMPVSAEAKASPILSSMAKKCETEVK